MTNCREIAAESKEHCSSETFHLHCPLSGDFTGTGSYGGIGRDRDFEPGSSPAIVVRRADYGRMRPARRCISSAYAESMGCRADVTGHLHSVCTGRSNCSLLVATMDSVSQPCLKDFKSYIEVVYECLTVSFIDDCVHSASSSHHANATGSHHREHLASSSSWSAIGGGVDGAIRLTKDRGNLALFANPDRASSGVTAGISSASGGHCHWVVEAPPGRTINFRWKLAGRNALENAVGSKPEMMGADARRDAADKMPYEGESPAAESGACPVAIMFREGERPGGAVVRTACATGGDGGGGSADHRHRHEDGEQQLASAIHSVEILEHESNVVSLGNSRGNGGRGMDSGEEKFYDVDLVDLGSEEDDESEGVFFQSSTNRLEIHPAISSVDPLVWNDIGGVGVKTVTDLWQPYILEYYFVGCENLIPPDGASVERSGDVTTISCDASPSPDSREIWQVTCQDGVWVGEIGNCTKAGLSDTKVSTANRSGQQSYSDIRNGVILAVLIGIFLGVVVGACLMMVVFVVKNRGSRYFKHDPTATTQSRTPPCGTVAGNGSGPIRCLVGHGLNDPYELRRTPVGLDHIDVETTPTPPPPPSYRAAACCDCVAMTAKTTTYESRDCLSGPPPRLLVPLHQPLYNTSTSLGRRTALQQQQQQMRATSYTFGRAAITHEEDEDCIVGGGVDLVVEAAAGVDAAAAVLSPHPSPPTLSTFYVTPRSKSALDQSITAGIYGCRCVQTLPNGQARNATSSTFVPGCPPSTGNEISGTDRTEIEQRSSPQPQQQQQHRQQPPGGNDASSSMSSTSGRFALDLLSHDDKARKAI